MSEKTEMTVDELAKHLAEAKRGMAYRYIGERFKETLAHYVHYFAGQDPCGHTWIFIGAIEGKQFLHWNGFPQEYERWPEKDQPYVRPAELRQAGVDGDVKDALERVIERAKAYTCTIVNHEVYKQNEQDCIDLRYALQPAAQKTDGASISAPVIVFYNAESDNFYDIETSKGMGQSFYDTFIGKLKDFRSKMLRPFDMKNPNEKDRAEAIRFCEMVEEIGEPDNTIIPVWPIDTEMAITHPLTVGMVKTFHSALTEKPRASVDVWQDIDTAPKDGTHVWVWWKTGGKYPIAEKSILHWRKDGWHWCESPNRLCAKMFTDFTPLLWQALPANPDAAKFPELVGGRE